MVMAVLDKSVDVFVMRSGVSKRVYLEKCGLLSWRMRKPRDKPPYLQLVWPEFVEGEKEEEEGAEERCVCRPTLVFKIRSFIPRND